ncbi:hypothetical protein RND71_025573 [Anisodus tanguticus]|uniref:OTU domain-containing protein n=1 Tax=Anisodus tanguticus TaxID=243964 RepID=A0AAE1V5X7_9SOLA|nr:hypothetical protein RND71_025573 [Anisodus tanguticus]
MSTLILLTARAGHHVVKFEAKHVIGKPHERNLSATGQRNCYEKGSKAEQRAKKKQVDEEVSKLSAKLKEGHAAELASLGYSGGINNDNGKEKGNLDTLVKAIAGVSVSSQTDHSKPSKSVKRREKRAQQEADREQRIQEEQSNIPDGHSVYRSVENQLAIHSGGSSPYTYLELRQMVAAYLRKHATDFLHFFLSENAEGEESDDSLVGRFDNYCREVESTAAWGGQLELGALTHILKKHMMIIICFPMWRWERSTNLGLALRLPV